MHAAALSTNEECIRRAYNAFQRERSWFYHICNRRRDARYIPAHLTLADVESNSKIITAWLQIGDRIARTYAGPEAVIHALAVQEPSCLSKMAPSPSAITNEVLSVARAVRDGVPLQFKVGIESIGVHTRQVMRECGAPHSTDKIYILYAMCRRSCDVSPLVKFIVAAENGFDAYARKILPQAAQDFLRNPEGCGEFLLRYAGLDLPAMFPEFRP